MSYTIQGDFSYFKILCCYTYLYKELRKFLLTIFRYEPIFLLWGHRFKHVNKILLVCELILVNLTSSKKMECEACKIRAKKCLKVKMYALCNHEAYFWCHLFLTYSCFISFTFYRAKNTSWIKRGRPRISRWVKQIESYCKNI